MALTDEDIVTLLGTLGPIPAGIGAAAAEEAGERTGPALGAAGGGLGGQYLGALGGALAGGGVGAGAGALYDALTGGPSFWEDLTNQPTGAQVGASYGIPLGAVAGGMAGGAYGSRKGYQATTQDRSSKKKKTKRDKTSSHQEISMSMQKVAAGYGAIARLNQEGIDPGRFVKVAAQSNDSELHVLADCIIAAAQDSARTKQANMGGAAPGRLFNSAGGGRMLEAGMKGRSMGQDVLDLPGNILEFIRAGKMRNMAEGDLGAAAELAGEGGLDALDPVELGNLNQWLEAAQSRRGQLGESIASGMGGAGAGLAGLGAIGAGGYGAYEGLREPTWQERLGIG